MGYVIRKTASGDDKIKDVRSSKLNADARGGIWKSIAEAKLGPTLVLIEKVEGDLAKQSQTALPLLAAASAAKKKADLLVGRVHDDIWNAMGRIALDPVLSAVFPGGYTYYTAGSTEDQPDRMELLASLLESGILTKLPSGMAQSLATEVRDGAGALRESLNAARAARAGMSLYEHMRLTLAQTGQIALAGLKRIYKAHGFTEAQIHQVIPDRTPPSSKKASAAAPATKAEAPAVALPKKAEEAAAAPEADPAAAAGKSATGVAGDTIDP